MKIMFICTGNICRSAMAHAMLTKRAIVDYMAGQTDQYFLNECIQNIREFSIEELYKQ